MSDLYPLTFEPEVLVKVWGGQKLPTLYNKPPSDQPLGESWEVSTLPGHVSIVSNGPLAGTALDSLIHDKGSELLGKLVFEKYGEDFPLLLKIIDASDDLSVQVHPNAEQAQKLGSGAQSKNEAWLVLQNDPGARLVQGVAEGISQKEFENLVARGRIEECLRFVEVQSGDVVPVPPGTLHAIGKGIVLLELQESSDTTYRFYDYGRLGLDGKPRELHIEQALAVVSLERGPATVRPTPLTAHGQRELLHADEALVMQRWSFDSAVSLDADADRFWLVTTLDGDVTIVSDSQEKEVHLPIGRSAMIPAQLEVTFHPSTPSSIHLGTVPAKS